MKNFREILKDGFEKNPTTVLSFGLAGASLALLILGFFIWNIYLYSLFGFWGDELLKGKFIFSGFIFSVISIIGFGFFLIIYQTLRLFFSGIFCHLRSDTRLKVENIRLKVIDSFIFKEVLILLSIMWLFIYPVYVFPLIPNSLGGGQPKSVSLIVTDQQMSLLNSLGIKKGDENRNAQNQTEWLCLVHENSDEIFLLQNDRVSEFNRITFSGLTTIPERGVNEQWCVDRAMQWANTGFQVELQLLQVESYNWFIAKPFGLPLRLLAIEKPKT